MTQVTRGPLVSALVAHYASACGNAVTVVTVPLYVLERTGSPLATGAAAIAGSVPLLFAGAIGGVWVDRLGGRTMSVLSDFAAGVLIALAPLLDRTVGLPLPVLFTVLFIRTIVATPAAAARVTLLPRLAVAAGVRLETVNSWYQAAPRLGLVVGAPLAALLVARSGGTAGLYADAASFFLAAVLVAVGVPRVRTARGDRGWAAAGPAHGRHRRRGRHRVGGASATDTPARPGTVTALREGIAAIRQLPVIAAMTVFVFVTNVLDDAFTPVILPVYAREQLHDGRYLGWFVAASGLGAVLGTFGYAPASRVVLAGRRRTLLGCFAVIGVLRLAMAAFPGPLTMTALCLLLGVATGPLNPVLTTVLLEQVPEQLRGRVFGLGASVAMSGAPVGILVAGWCVEGPGLRTTLLLFGGAYLVLVLVSLRTTALHDMDAGGSADAARGSPVDQQTGTGDEGRRSARQESDDTAEVGRVA